MDGAGGTTGSVTAGSGAGNPNGEGSYSGYKGENGTGGLLIIYADTFDNSGVIKSNGSKGGETRYEGAGGGSGAGTINIFYNNLSEKGTINAISGNAGGGIVYTQQAQNGENGSISMGNISTGNYVAD